MYSVDFFCCGKILEDIRVATIVNQLVQGQSKLHPDIICLLIEMLSAALRDRLDLAILLGQLLPTFSQERSLNSVRQGASMETILSLSLGHWDNPC